MTSMQLDHASTLEIVQDQLTAIAQLGDQGTAVATLAQSCKRLIAGMQNDLDCESES